MSSLKIENLVCGYDSRKPVIKDISFSVDDGQFVGIVGPNGAGKTTLLRAVVGLLKVQHGSIAISNHKIQHLHRPAPPPATTRSNISTGANWPAESLSCRNSWSRLTASPSRTLSCSAARRI